MATDSRGDHWYVSAPLEIIEQTTAACAPAARPTPPSSATPIRCAARSSTAWSFRRPFWKISLESPWRRRFRRVRSARPQCLEFAVGSVGHVLGPNFAAIDAFPQRVRLPDEPLMLVDRITLIEGEPLSLTFGRVVTEHDVRPGAGISTAAASPPASPSRRARRTSSCPAGSASTSACAAAPSTACSTQGSRSTAACPLPDRCSL